MLPKPAATPGAVGSSPGPARVAIIGCGAIVEHAYLPALAGVESVEPILLVDREPARAAALAKRWGVPRTGGELPGRDDGIDAAIVAVPNHLHCPVACRLLRQGIPVLVEKPMALNVAECDEMLKAAEEGGAPLAVGFVCRFGRAARCVKEWLEGGLPGAPVSFHAENGGIFGWPLASDYLFRREMSGGGVLMDVGSHLLDLLTWWLGPVREAEHDDDGFGGVEADSLTHLTMEAGAAGTVRLSRTCPTRQSILLECERADLHVHLDRPAVEMRLKDSFLSLEGEIREAGRGGAGDETFTELFARQFQDWGRSIREGCPTTVADGHAGRRVVSLIETCYARRRPWRLPWLWR